MENASKALIIAGAILLAILIISLGILVYNNAKDTVSDANLDSEEAQTFNVKISQYCGTKKSANDMNGLIDAIASSNGAQMSVSKAERHMISVTVSGDTNNDYHTGGSVTVSADSTGSLSYPSFSEGTTYSATYTTDASTGYINMVTITIN